MQLLHPFMPFITEEIWQALPHEGETIMLQPFPVYDEKNSYPEAAREMTMVMEAIKAIRIRRAEMNVPPSRKAKVYIAAKEQTPFLNGRLFFSRLAGASDLSVADSYELSDTITLVTADAKIYIPIDDLIDKAAEKDLAFNEKKLSNQGFIAKAPEKVVNEVKANAARLAEKIKMIKAVMETLQ